MISLLGLDGRRGQHQSGRGQQGAGQTAPRCAPSAVNDQRHGAAMLLRMMMLQSQRQQTAIDFFVTGLENVN